jgi:exodeoxyribonuclease V alpha subunit
MFGHAVEDPAITSVAVTIPDCLCVVPVEPGQWWLITGPATTAEFSSNGYRMQETRIRAKKALFMRPSGEHLVHLLATSPSFPGIGQVAARRLWEAFGESLYARLDEGDPTPFEAQLGTNRAQVLVQGWQSFRDADALQLMHRLGIPPRVIRRFLACYPAEARQRLTEDPFRLLAFGLPWGRVDEIAAKHFEIPPTDVRRLAAAVEAAAYEAFDEGHTWCSDLALKKAISLRLGVRYTEDAMKLAEEMHHVERTSLGLHPLGPMAMETGIAEAISARLSPVPPLVGRDAVDAALLDFEKQEVLHGIASFELNTAQRAAVHGAVETRILLITGGAGVGKTTVMKAVNRTLRTAGTATFLMALSGKAARRLSEATGAEAMTIAGFLQNVAPLGIPDNSALIVDEASMVDVILLYRLIRAVPESCRLLLIGDPAQLTPVGPGLTLHALVNCSGIPRVELTETRRFTGELAKFANAVRVGTWVEPNSRPDSAVSFLHCAPDEIAHHAAALRREASDEAQILTFTRKVGPASATTLNRVCQTAFKSERPKVRAYNAEHHRWEDSGLRLGDPVLCNRNHWDLGLQNGSLGIVVDVELSNSGYDNDVVAHVEWDDGETRVVAGELLDSLELGYAITVHKAQGSQWPYVIVPVYPSRNLDRTMLYTALTRASERVVFVGNAHVARQAVEALPFAAHRRSAISFFMEHQQ